MKLIFAIPHGERNTEGASLAVLARYLRPHYDDVSFLSCDGLFSTCGRDASSRVTDGWTRCAGCMMEQSRISSWIGLPLLSLGDYLEATEVRRSVEWLATLADDELETAQFLGVPVLDRGRRYPKPSMRSEFLSALRALLSARRFMAKVKPDVLFVAETHDFISASFLALSQGMKCRVVLVQAGEAPGVMRFIDSQNGAHHESLFMIQDLGRVRDDISTWAAELTESIEELLLKLGLSAEQLILPMAR